MATKTRRSSFLRPPYYVVAADNGWFYVYHQTLVGSTWAHDPIRLDIATREEADAECRSLGGLVPMSESQEKGCQCGHSWLFHATRGCMAQNGKRRCACRKRRRLATIWMWAGWVK